MFEYHWTEVDGITTLWTEMEGPLRAGLSFRTGRADETLVTSGHTHLIEHMTLSTMSANPQMSNGFVMDFFTSFVTMGNPEDVSAFLSGVCKSLQSLPLNRLEAEKQILLAESATQHYDFRLNLLKYRFGAAGPGLAGMRELGVQGATLEQLEQRRLQQFTRQNAILWLSGPLPANLHLDLPSGIKQPLPPLKATQLIFPAWFTDNDSGGIAVGATVPRVIQASIFCMLAQKRLHEWLRIKHAVSYTPVIFYDHLNADTAHLTLYADSDQDHRNELTEAFGECYEKLTEFDEAEVEIVKKQYREQAMGSLAPPVADRAFVEIQRVAADWLFGRKHESTEEIVEQALLLSTADLAAFSQNLQQAALFALPGNVKTWRSWMGEKVLPSNGPTVAGEIAMSIDAPIQTQWLVYGPEGVSMKWPDGSHITIRYSTLAAALHFDDGGVYMIDVNGSWMSIEPTLWRNGSSVCWEIYDRVPEDLLIEQGERSAEKIPKPTTTAWQRFRASLNKIV